MPVRTPREAIRHDEAPVEPAIEAPPAQPAQAPVAARPAELRESADPVARLETQNRELLAEVERWRALAEDKDRYARASAVEARQTAEELERAKARIAKEARKEAEQSKREVLIAMLEVLDDLDRAIAAAEDGPQLDPAFSSGVRLVRKNFLGKLAHFDVVRAPCLGETFDPERHEAVSIVPVREPERDGAIVGVVREGYTIGRDILRPAAVAVGRLAPVARAGHS